MRRPLEAAESQGLRLLVGDEGQLTVDSRDFRRNELIRSLEL